MTALVLIDISHTVPESISCPRASAHVYKPPFLPFALSVSPVNTDCIIVFQRHSLISSHYGDNPNCEGD